MRKIAALPGDVTWMMHYAPRRRLLYMVQPKVACSTVKLTLQNAELGRCQELDIPELAERIHGPEPTILKPANDVADLERFVRDALIRFCFVRNPYARALSAYLDKMAPSPLTPIFGAKLGIPEQDLGRPVTFIDFLERVAAQAPADMDVHWRPQTYLYDFLEPVVGFDFVGAFETFNDDFRTVLTVTDPALLDYVSVFNPHMTKAASRVAEYYRDPRARTLAETVYRQDFERFGYPMDLERVAAAPVAERWRNDRWQNGRVE